MIDQTNFYYLLNAAIKGDKTVKDALSELATKAADIQLGQ